jgi:hypothetical protein
VHVADLVPSTARNDLASPFLSLPGELRNQIYGYLLTSDMPLCITRRRSPDNKHRRSRGLALLSGGPPGLAIMTVCRKTYQETKLLPFIFNTIQINSLAILERMYTRISLEQRQCVEEFRLVTQVEHYDNIIKLLSSKTPRLTTILPNVRSVSVTVLGHQWSFGRYPNLDMMDCLESFLLREDGEELRRAYDGDSLPLDWKPIENMI